LSSVVSLVIWCCSCLWWSCPSVRSLFNGKDLCLCTCLGLPLSSDVSLLIYCLSCHLLSLLSSGASLVSGGADLRPVLVLMGKDLCLCTCLGLSLSSDVPLVISCLHGHLVSLLSSLVPLVICCLCFHLLPLLSSMVSLVICCLSCHLVLLLSLVKLAFVCVLVWVSSCHLMCLVISCLPGHLVSLLYSLVPLVICCLCLCWPSASLFLMGKDLCLCTCLGLFLSYDMETQAGTRTKVLAH
jgi:hypothetical protein